MKPFFNIKKRLPNTPNPSFLYVHNLQSSSNFIQLSLVDVGLGCSRLMAGAIRYFHRQHQAGSTGAIPRTCAAMVPTACGPAGASSPQKRSRRDPQISGAQSGKPRRAHLPRPTADRSVHRELYVSVRPPCLGTRPVPTRSPPIHGPAAAPLACPRTRIQTRTAWHEPGWNAARRVVLSKGGRTQG